MTDEELKEIERGAELKRLIEQTEQEEHQSTVDSLVQIAIKQSEYAIEEEADA